MRNYKDGWTSQDWDTLTESTSALFSAVAELDNGVGGGGGGFSPTDLSAHLAKIEALTKKLQAIASSYY